MKNKQKIIILYFFIFFFLIFTKNIFSQTQENYSDIILTWRAHNYTPNNYLNKNLPTKNSLLEFNTILIKNNKIIDLNKYIISWYLDYKLIKEDYNAKKIFLNINKPSGNVYFLTVKITDEELQEEFKKTIAIDIFKPKIGLEINFLKNTIFLKALPYFFNIENIYDLNFNWQIDNEIFNVQGDNELILKNINKNIKKIKLNIINNKNLESATIIKNL